MLNDSDGRLSLVWGQLGIESPHVIIYHQRHQCWQKFGHNLRVQLGLPEQLALYHVPAMQSQCQHSKHQHQHRIVLEKKIYQIYSNFHHVAKMYNFPYIIFTLVLVTVMHSKYFTPKI